MDFSTLISNIRETHVALQQDATKAINRALTIRNWLIGFYIVEFEQKGGKAKYGDRLLKELALAIKIKGLSETTLKINRLFYLTYPQVARHITEHLYQQNGSSAIYQAIRIKLLDNDIQSITICQTSDKSIKPLSVPAEKLLEKLSFSHITELLFVQDDLKRAFYEMECIKGHWSVRELKRQINSLYFERSGLSSYPEKLSARLMEKAEQLQPVDIIKSVYTFEFLGLPAKAVVEESDLETALLTHLQDFMLELGHGFCLEARQKRILIGDEYFFIDLVFYHRLLKCHVLVELKIEAFNHSNAGQMNTYLNYYKKEVMQPTDNPPVGILLVTNKNETLVEYATAGMDQQLFVSKYLVKLPTVEQLEHFVQNEWRQL